MVIGFIGVETYIPREMSMATLRWMRVPDVEVR